MNAQPPATPPPPPPQQPPPPPPAGAPAGSPAGIDYPVHLDIDRQEEYSRFYPLVKWLAVIPNVIVLVFVGIAALIVHLIAFFAVLFTARYPRGMFDFVVGVMRWGERAGAYLYLMTDRYPPFSTKDDPSFPVRFNIDYPEPGVDRWRPLVHWLLIIPYAIVAAVLGYLAGIVSFIALFAILFTKRFPEGMFNLVLIPFRWQARANAYAYFLVTRYPPWVWD
jgi:hypothetical protein